MATEAYGIITNNELASLFPNKDIVSNDRCPTYSEIISYGVSTSASYSTNQCVKYQDIIVSTFDGLLRIYGQDLYRSDVSGSFKLYGSSSGSPVGYTGNWSGRPSEGDPILVGPLQFMTSGKISSSTWNSIYFEFTLGASAGKSVSFQAKKGTQYGSYIASDVNYSNGYTTGIKKLSTYWSWDDYDNNGVGIYFTYA